MLQCIRIFSDVSSRDGIGIERGTYNYCAHRAVTAAQIQGDPLRLRTPMRSDPDISTDGSARRMKGQVFAVRI